MKWLLTREVKCIYFSGVVQKEENNLVLQTTVPIRKRIRKGTVQNVCRSTIEILQRVRIFKANCCLQVHNAHIKHCQFLDKLSGKNSLADVI